MEYWQDPQDTRHTQFNFFGHRQSVAPGVKWLIIINVVIFLMEALGGGNVGSLIDLLNLYPPDVFGRGYVWQLATYAFLHDPNSIFHILFNMLFLHWFGRAVEQTWGTRRFVLFYLGGAIFAGLVYSLVHFIRPSPPCIGASGAVMAVMMAYALWFPNQIVLFMLVIPMRIRTFIGLLVVIETVSWLNPTNNVANMAHLGGLLYGYLVVRFGPQIGHISHTSERREYEPNVDDERRLDEVLDKIRTEGIGALTWGERRFLKRMGQRRQ